MRIDDIVDLFSHNYSSEKFSVPTAQSGHVQSAGS
jgi:hypothetical protein